MDNYSGTLRIKNPKTLKKWQQNGSLQNQAKNGWVFAKRCGRFRKHVCYCASCRKSTSAKYYGSNGWFEVTREELIRLKQTAKELI